MLVDNIWGYDFECYSKINWWCVTFINYKNRKNIITIINDRNEFVEFYNAHKDDIFVDYNGRHYDSWIWKAILYNMKVGFVNDELIKYGKKGFQIIKNANKYQLNTYDTMLKDKSLKQLEGFMGSTIKETDVPFDIDRPLTDDEIKEIIMYNIHDVEETLKVLDYTYEDFESQLDMVNMFDLDMAMFNKTKAQLSAHILGAVRQHTLDDEFEYSFPNTLVLSNKYSHILDWYKNPKNLSYKLPLCSESKQDVNQLITTVGGCETVFGSGGLHAAKPNLVYEGIIVCMDVGSLYPSIDIEYEYISRKIVNPKKYTQIRDVRLELKAKKDKRQKPYKIVLNATYGAKKDRNNALYDPLMSNNTCLTGQLLMTDLCEKIEDLGEVLQINTDGIYIGVTNKDNINKIIKRSNEWENRTRLSLDFDVYEHGKLIQKDVNNYLLMDKSDNHYKCKGAYVKKLSPIDYDLPIINKALVNYFVHDIPVETTINEEDNLIEFQKIIKLTNLYKDVVYGEGKKVKVLKSNGATEQYVEKTMVEDGKKLNEKVHRVFASINPNDKGIYKVKIEKGQKSFEKIANTPDKCFIYNDSLNVNWYFDKDIKTYKYDGLKCLKVPEYLDRQYYIDVAHERIKQFLETTPEKQDDTPNILFECYKSSQNFYEFLCKIEETNITNKVLDSYLIADCCNIYGKTQKLLEFKEYFKILYKKDNFTVRNIEKKINNIEIMNVIKNNCELSQTGKKYINVDYEKILLKIFDLLENNHINEYDIMAMQISKFNSIRYINSDLKHDRYFVMNVRNVIKPNVIIYNMKNGIIEYRKVKENIFNILPLQDGDIIDIKSTEVVNGYKIIGKDDTGINMLEEDNTKKYNLITGYDIVQRNYNKNTKLISDNEEGA